MPLQLYIDEQEIDLEPGTLISPTYQVNTINSLSNLQANFTRSFTVNPTANNNKILGFANQISSNTDIPYRELPARVVQNGIEIINNGSAYITSYQGKYRISVRSGNYDFFNTIAGKSIQDIDFDDLDYNWTLGDAIALKDLQTGVFYPIVQYGNLATSGNTFDIRYSHHSVYVHTIVDRIFEEAGFAKAGELFQDLFYKSLNIPFSNTNFLKTSVEVESSADEDYNTFNNGFVNIEFDTTIFDIDNEWDGTSTFTFRS